MTTFLGRAVALCATLGILFLMTGCGVLGAMANPKVAWAVGDPAPMTIVVRRADAADANFLFPIQKLYELEEVVITPSHFDDGQCLRSLRIALKEQIVYVAELSGAAVAKAGTNARGYTVDQIGGVYTVPSERGKGLGKAVVSELLKNVFSEKKEACLFVKKHNRSAIALYERLGFAPVNDYVISYYGL